MPCEFDLDFVDTATVTWSVSGNSVTATATATGGGGGSTSVFSLTNNPDGSTTIVHDPGDGTGPTTSTIPAVTDSVSTLTVGANADGSQTVAHTPGDGSAATTFTIPAASAGGTAVTSALSVTSNTDGTQTVTHNSGAAGSVDTTFTIPADCTTTTTAAGTLGQRTTITGPAVILEETMPAIVATDSPYVIAHGLASVGAVVAINQTTGERWVTDWRHMTPNDPTSDIGIDFTEDWAAGEFAVRITGIADVTC